MTADMSLEGSGKSFVGCYILVYGEFVLFSYILDMIGAHVSKLKLCVPFVSALAFRYICIR